MLANRNDISECNKPREKYVSMAACLAIVAPSIISLFNGAIRSVITIPFKLDTVFIYGVFVFIFILSLSRIIKRSLTTHSIFVAIAISIISYLITFLINSNNTTYFINIGIDFLIRSIPWLLVGFAVRDYRVMKKYINLSGVIIITSFSYNFFILKANLFGDGFYSQQYSYTLLIAAIIFTNSIYEKKRFYNIVLLFFTLILMTLLGARGPLVCYILYVGLKNYVSLRLNIKKVTLNLAITTITVILIYVFHPYILNKLLFLSNKMNLSTRIIHRILGGAYFLDNSRVSLVEYSIELLKQYPLLGVGVGNDRLLLANKIGVANSLSEVVGWYPHNIFLEILLHFGIIIGSILIIYMLRIMYVSVRKIKNKDVIDIISIFIGIGFFPLFFSSSYIESPIFFVLIGMCLYQYEMYMSRTKKKNLTTNIIC